MKYKKIFLFILSVFVVLAGILFFNKDDESIHQDLIDQIDFHTVDCLMIVAHPDDETIWGGKHLLDDHYLVVCLTNKDNETRKNEFMNIIKETHNQGLIFDYPDKTNGKRDNWSQVKQDIMNDIRYLLEKKDWKMIVTHNPEGEYGHIHHQMTSRFVTKYVKETDKLYYFGKYYKKKNKPVDLQQINEDDLEKKMSLAKIYGSQSRVIEHLGHMMAHENWVKAKEWK